MAGIFISYRRDDTQWPAGRIFDRLAAKIDGSKIFMDVDGIPPGVDFVEELGKRVGSCDALVALIGKSWTAIQDEDGRRRLDDPKDFVRIEIESALERDVRVIPVLIDGARMPRSEELPFAIKSFARRHAVEVSHTSFASDTDRLCGTLMTSLKLDPNAPSVRPLRERIGHAAEEFGGYSHEAMSWIEGRYLTLRPTFSPAGSVLAYCTEIKWDSGLNQLVFNELNRGDGVHAHSGLVSAPYQSGAIYLITNGRGPVRLAVLSRPTINGEIYGLLTTLREEHGAHYKPASCPIAFIPETRVAVPISYGRLAPGTAEFAYATGILERVSGEGHAAYFKPPRPCAQDTSRKPRESSRRRVNETAA